MDKVQTNKPTLRIVQNYVDMFTHTYPHRFSLTLFTSRH